MQRKKLKVLIPVEVRRKKEGSLHIWKGCLNCVPRVSEGFLQDLRAKVSLCPPNSGV